VAPTGYRERGDGEYRSVPAEMETTYHAIGHGERADMTLSSIA
jgi:hypothetical protein